MKKLSFSNGNAKLAKGIHTFSLPAGHTCPGACQCLAKADQVTGKIWNGPKQVFRCFAASGEAFQPSARLSHWSNKNQLTGISRPSMATIILDSLPPKAKIIRVHMSGDFFSYQYFLAWVDVARERPDVLFYGYSKSLPFFIQYFGPVHDGRWLPNFIFTASRGGKYDSLIDQHSLRESVVVYSKGEAKSKGLAIDIDDSLAMKADKSFALLIHGTQSKGTKAAKAWAKIRQAKMKGNS